MIRDAPVPSIDAAMSRYDLYLMLHISGAMVWVGTAFAMVLLATRAMVARNAERMTGFHPRRRVARIARVPAGESHRPGVRRLARLRRPLGLRAAVGPPRRRRLRCELPGWRDVLRTGMESDSASRGSGGHGCGERRVSAAAFARGVVVRRRLVDRDRLRNDRQAPAARVVSARGRGRIADCLRARRHRAPSCAGAGCPRPGGGAVIAVRGSVQSARGGAALARWSGIGTVLRTGVT